MKYFMTNKNRYWAMLTLILVALMFFIGIYVRSNVEPPAFTEQKQSENSSPLSPSPPPTRVIIAVVGDLLIHSPITKAAAVSGGKYDFMPAFQHIKSFIEFPDFTIANLETKLAGAAKGYSGYPLFNTPAELAIGMKNSGIDLAGTANNHSLDQGVDGLVTTLNNLDAAAMPHVGTSRTLEEKKEIFVVDLKGIKLAVLNYTYGTNGLKLPTDKKFMVNMLDPKQAATDAQEAKRAHADIVMAFVHWGNEYQRKPSAVQRKAAAVMCEGGVDFIIGAHPHVVQPIERIQVKRAGAPYECLVVYSLGNFISNQRDRYRDSGLIVYVDIEKDQDQISVLGVRYLPTYVQRGYADGKLQYRVLPVHSDINPESDIPLSSDDQKRIKQVWEEMQPFLNKPQQDILPLSVKTLKAQK